MTTSDKPRKRPAPTAATPTFHSSGSEALLITYPDTGSDVGPSDTSSSSTCDATSCCQSAGDGS